MTAQDRSIAPLNVLIDVLEELRDIHLDLTLTQALVFLHVAASPTMSQLDIARVLDISGASVSRIHGMLGSYGNRGTGPFHLLTSVEDLGDRRRKEVVLTDAGKGLVQRLLRTLARLKTNGSASEGEPVAG